MHEPEVVVQEDEACGAEAAVSARWLRRDGAGRGKWPVLTAGEYEERVRELDDWEASQVLRVYDVRADAHGAEEEGEAIEGAEEDLDGDDGVDEARQKLFGEDCVLFDQFREVIEAGSFRDARLLTLLKTLERLPSVWKLTDCECQESEPQEETQVANEGKNPHAMAY